MHKHSCLIVEIHNVNMTMVFLLICVCDLLLFDGMDKSVVVGMICMSDETGLLMFCVFCDVVWYDMVLCGDAVRGWCGVCDGIAFL